MSEDDCRPWVTGACWVQELRNTRSELETSACFSNLQWSRMHLQVRQADHPFFARRFHAHGRAGRMVMDQKPTPRGTTDISSRQVRILARGSRSHEQARVIDEMVKI
jgi:hypothetical protein